MSGFTVGDTSPALTGQCKDGAAGANITGATNVVAHIRRADNTILTVPVNVTVGANGEWAYDWSANDLNVAGDWVIEVQVTYGNGKIQTFGPGAFPVRPQIA